MKPRFLQCRAALSVYVLKKFIRLKFDLRPETCVRADLITPQINDIDDNVDDDDGGL